MLFRSATIANRFEENWKRRTLIRFDAKASLSAMASFANLGDWQQVRRRLERTPEVQALDVLAMTHRDAQVLLHYYGDPPRLALALAQSDLDLSEHDGFWSLRLKAPGTGSAAAPPATAAPAPAK